jgi:parallel beta-helix repeat protein
MSSGVGVEDATWQNYGDYVDIIGFDISGAGSLGIMNLGSHVRIIGNHVHDIPARSGCVDGMGGAGIDNGEYAAHDNEVIANRVHDVGNYASPCSSVHGIYHSNKRGAIYNNVVYRNQGWGIHLWHAATDVIVSNNDVFDNGYGGIVVGAGDSPGGVTNDNTVVVNNIVVHNGNYGIEEYGRTGLHNHYLNNLLHGNQRAPFRLLNNSKGLNTVQADPSFVDYKADGSGDYHLRFASPAIDAGTNQGAPQTDFDGNNRPVGKGWDIGAYEYVSKPLQSSVQQKDR